MPETQQETGTTCTTCDKNGPQGLLFCVFCGAKTSDPERDSTAARTNCPFCHCADEFSRAFCTVCGAQLNQGEANVKLRALNKRTGFNWSLPNDEKSVRLIGGARNFGMSPPAERKVTPRSPLILYCATGIMLGLVAAALLATLAQEPINYLLARAYAMHRGLVVAIQLEGDKDGDPHTAQVKLVNQADQTKTYEGLTDKGGLLSTDILPAGKYQLHISAPNHETAFGLINIEDQRPTLVGFPTPISLPRQQPL
jgi:hypothetical protein